MPNPATPAIVAQPPLTTRQRLERKAQNFSEMRAKTAQDAVENDLYKILSWDSRHQVATLRKRVNADGTYTVCLETLSCNCPDAARLESVNCELRAAGLQGCLYCKHISIVHQIVSDLRLLAQAMEGTIGTGVQVIATCSGYRFCMIQDGGRFLWGTFLPGADLFNAFPVSGWYSLAGDAEANFNTLSAAEDDSRAKGDFD